MCYRLYSEDDYYEMMEYSIPEILRGNLDDTVLLIHLLHTLKILSIGSMDQFPLLDCPSHSTIRHAEKRLENYGALNHDHEITSLGVLLSSLPLPISQGYFLILSTFLGQPYFGVILCATLSFQVVPSLKSCLVPFFESTTSIIDRSEQPSSLRSSIR